MVTTTTNSIEGQRIVKYKKVLVAQSMIGGKMGCKEGEEPKSVYDMTHEEFVKAFGEDHKSELLRPSTFNPDDKDKYMLDLWAACRLVFLEAGIPEEHIEITDYCTRCNPKLFYSHRIMGANRGSLAAFISL